MLAMSPANSKWACVAISLLLRKILLVELHLCCASCPVEDRCCSTCCSKHHVDGVQLEHDDVELVEVGRDGVQLAQLVPCTAHCVMEGCVANHMSPCWKHVPSIWVMELPSMVLALYISSVYQRNTCWWPCSQSRWMLSIISSAVVHPLRMLTLNTSFRLSALLGSMLRQTSQLLLRHVWPKTPQVLQRPLPLCCSSCWSFLERCWT